MKPQPLSIVIPVRNDARALARLLADLQRLPGPAPEILVVDGGSGDGSADVARRSGARLLQSAPGRGVQINAGVQAATGEWIWIVHADTRLPVEAADFIRRRPAPGWGRFDVAFDPAFSVLPLVAVMMNWRSRLTGICTGDQAIFCHRGLLEAVQGVPEIPLMEDIELSRRLKTVCRPACPGIRVITSPRRWQRDGVLRTVLRMWWFRFRYWAGAEPEDLARAYYR